MQINNLFDSVIRNLFTLAVIFIGLPISAYLLKKGIEGFTKYKFGKLPANFLFAPGLGNYSVEITFYGLFILAFSLWYLFFDQSGELSKLLIVSDR